MEQSIYTLCIGMTVWALLMALLNKKDWQFWAGQASGCVSIAIGFFVVVNL